jgi:hypothetical protein
MHTLTRCFLLLGCLAVAGVVSAQDRGDWAKGWTTWSEAKVGDWVEQSIGTFARARFEVTAVSGGRVSYTHTTYNAAGEKTAERNRTQLLRDLPRARLPAANLGVVVEWSKQETVIGQVKLECDVASWEAPDDKGGFTRMSIWYSTQVPCGGMVKTTTGGVTTVWVINFKTEDMAKPARAANDSDEGQGSTAEDEAKPQTEPATGDGETVESKLPRFFAHAGNHVVLQLSRGGDVVSHQRREVTQVAAEVFTVITTTPSDEEGRAQPNSRQLTAEQTLAAWQETYKEPAEKGVAIKTPAGEFTCDMFKRTEGGREITEWISQGLTVRMIVKAGGQETLLEAIKVEMK